MKSSAIRVHRRGACDSVSFPAAVCGRRKTILSFAVAFVSILRRRKVKMFQGEFDWLERHSPVMTLAGYLSTLTGALTLLWGCSAQPPLSITLYHPETKQTLTCSARSQLSDARSEALAAAVETCAQQLEANGFVRR